MEIYFAKGKLTPQNSLSAVPQLHSAQNNPMLLWHIMGWHILIPFIRLLSVSLIDGAAPNRRRRRGAKFRWEMMNSFWVVLAKCACGIFSGDVLRREK